MTLEELYNEFINFFKGIITLVISTCETIEFHKHQEKFLWSDGILKHWNLEDILKSGPFSNSKF